MIKQGARLVETAQDVLDELHLQRPVLQVGDLLPDESPQSSAAGHDEPTADPVLAAMGYDPVSQEALCARTGLGPAALSARLFELELLGEVARLPGQLFQRVGRA